MSYNLETTTKTIEVKQRDSIRMPFTITLNEEPVDITGLSVYFRVKQAISDSTYVIDEEFTDHIDPINGQTIIFIPSDKIDIDDGIYYYSIVVVSKDGEGNIVTQDTYMPEPDKNYYKFIVKPGF